MYLTLRCPPIGVRRAWLLRGGFLISLALIGLSVGSWLVSNQGYHSLASSGNVAMEKTANTGEGVNQIPNALAATILQTWQASASPVYSLQSVAGTADKWKATNPAQNFTLGFDAAGVRVNSWQLGLATTQAATPVVKGNRIEYDRTGGLTEWYANGPAGLEQGFTLAQPPTITDADGWYSLPIKFDGVRLSSDKANPDWLTLLAANGQVLARYGQVYSYATNQQPLETHLTSGPDAQTAYLRVNLTGATYPVVIDPFIQQQELAPDTITGPNMWFGYNLVVSRDGNTALVHAPYEQDTSDTSSGVIYVFGRNGTTWTQQQKLTIPSTDTNSRFGDVLAISGDSNVALISFVDSNSSVAYFYVRNGNTWTQQQQIPGCTAYNQYDNNYYSYSYALSSDGNTAIIGGCYDETTNVTFARIFVRDGASWVQQQELTPDTQNGVFGNAVALSADDSTLAIGAASTVITGSNQHGAVYIYNHSGTNWNLQQLIPAPSQPGGSYFGYSLALNANGGTAIIGAYDPGGLPETGAIYIWVRVGENWTQQYSLVDKNNFTNYGLGRAVALSPDGNVALFSRTLIDIFGSTHPGLVFLLTRNDADWTFQQLIAPTDTGGGDGFGNALAMVNSNGKLIALIGAPGHGRALEQGAVYSFQFFQPSTTTLATDTNPVGFGQSVTFTATLSPITATGTVTFSIDSGLPVTTTLAGNVATYVTNTLSLGQHKVVATYNGDSNFAPSSATLTQTVTAGPPVQFVAVSGSAQSAAISTTFGAPLVARVTDVGSNPVSGTVVTFTVPTSGPGGTFAGGAAVYSGTTDASGTVTSTAFTANLIAGSYVMSASVAGVTTPATFALTNTTGNPTQISAVSGTPQSAVVSTTFAAPLVARVRDVGSNPVSNSVVTFTAPVSGSSGSFAGGAAVYTDTTDASGTVTATAFMANAITGAYSVTASVGGVITPASFQLTNLASCTPLYVNSTGDDGSCGTLRQAVAATSSGSSKNITITLAANSVITLTTGLTLTSGVSITTTAPCGVGPNNSMLPPIVIQGGSSNGLTLAGSNSLYGLWIRGFSGVQIKAPVGSHTTMQCVKASKS